MDERETSGRLWVTRAIANSLADLVIKYDLLIIKYHIIVATNMCQMFRIWHFDYLPFLH